MTKQEIDILLKNAEYQFAKTMPKNPHSYTVVNKHWINRTRIFKEVVAYIKDNAVKEYWNYGKYYNYYYANGYKYWLGLDSYETILINRASI